MRRSIIAEVTLEEEKRFRATLDTARNGLV